VTEKVRRASCWMEVQAFRRALLANPEGLAEA
jgi:hypothetical protein